jgi:hypothetical protein
VELDGLDQRFKLAVDEFANGDPVSTKALFSHRDDATVANPFGPIAHGWSRLELEHWQAKVGEPEDVTTFVLRVTTALRREQDSWKIIHRHADPIPTFDPSGPMRGSHG